jgi:hypothetical protein
MVQKYFDSGNRLTMDACAIQTREYENQSLLDYNTFNFYTSCDTKKKADALVTEYPNLRYHMGYGVSDPSVIDDDSKIRIGGQTLRTVENQQLQTRLFQAVPSLDRGVLVPNLESAIKNGSDTSIYNDCHNLAEFQTMHPTPLTECMQQFISNAGASIPSIPSIGVPSKDIFMAQRKVAENKC